LPACLKCGIFVVCPDESVLLQICRIQGGDVDGAAANLRHGVGHASEIGELCIGWVGWLVKQRIQPAALYVHFPVVILVGVFGRSANGIAA
jgi:hypothetical protein